MGTSSSRLGSRPSRTRVNRTNRNRTSISSLLICGGSSSHAPLEMEEYPAEIAVNSAEHCDPVINLVQKPPEASSSIFSIGTDFSGTNSEAGTSSESNIQSSEYTSVGDGLRNVETSNQGKCLAQTELFGPCQVSSDFSHGESYRDRSSTAASTSFNEQESSDPVSVNVLTNEDAVNGIDNSANEAVSQICHEPRRSPPQGLGDSPSGPVSDENHVDEITATHILDTDSVPYVSGLPVTFHSLRDEAISSGLGFLVSNREQGREDGGVLHVDVVSISSNILPSANIDTSNHEARRNSRRLFWDAFSRRSSRRLSDSPTIVFSTDDTDELGSRDRWLLDFSGDLFDDGVRGDSGYLGSRIHSLNERRLYSRSEIWERLHGGIDENDRRNTFCPSGLHPDGACSCESFLMTEESSTRASISRIVMLAEALFEVLDEIHRQPVSLPLSMVSLPAPESVVDSFALKNHKKVDSAKGGDDVEQCYICLAEYEDGDKIRVLPCHHEYHMSCVDKWLKEIHGVCPLCRKDVRQGMTECSNSKLPSLS